MEDVSHLTGENMMKRAPKNMILNEIRFNGKTGVFTYVDLVGRKDGEKAREEDLGQTVSVVILKMRRRVQGYNKPLKTFYTSTEHNTKNDIVYMFGAKEKGPVEELYNKYKAVNIKMQAQRVIYCLLIKDGSADRELVRLIVKGATLNFKRDGKAEGTMDFFAYTQREKPKGEHIYTSVTKVYSGAESGPLGEYYVMYFKPGMKIPEEKMGIIISNIKEIAVMTDEQDNFNKAADTKSEDIEKGLPTVDYSDESEDEEDVNIEDIPF